jgi:hypothetical protein
MELTPGLIWKQGEQTLRLDQCQHHCHHRRLSGYCCQLPRAPRDEQWHLQLVPAVPPVPGPSPQDRQRDRHNRVSDDGTVVVRLVCCGCADCNARQGSWGLLLVGEAENRNTHPPGRDCCRDCGRIQRRRDSSTGYRRRRWWQLLSFDHGAARGWLIGQLERLNDLFFNVMHLTRYHERMQRGAKINVQQLSTHAVVAAHKPLLTTLGQKGNCVQMLGD